jgi:DNA-binding MarR family transcriptional regulator
LIERGAIAWPEPVNSEAFRLFMKDGTPVALPLETELTFNDAETISEISQQEEVSIASVKEAKDTAIPPAELIRRAAEQAILQTLKDNPLSDVDLAKALDLTKPQLKAWLEGLLTNHLIEKTKRPVRYRVAVKQPELFDI